MVALKNLVVDAYEVRATSTGVEKTIAATEQLSAATTELARESGQLAVVTERTEKRTQLGFLDRRHRVSPSALSKTHRSMLRSMPSAASATSSAFRASWPTL